jgi:adenine-specific DNA-methyltransferase
LAKTRRTKSEAKNVGSYRHQSEKRKNIPTGEYQSVLSDAEKTPIQVEYERSNPDLDPQLVWRGKDLLDMSDLTVSAPPLYIQEKVHARVLVDDLMRQTDDLRKSDQHQMELELFSDFNGIPNEAAKTEFYQHDANWTNRMILGDSLQVMASLGEREGLRGKVQCIYIDPPYGIKFNSNFQWSTTSRTVSDGNSAHVTREPEQVKAFRDTWRDGVNTYLTYLKERLITARDLLSDSGSIFMQIGEDNVHRVRSVMDEVFGAEHFIAMISVKKTGGVGAKYLDTIFDYILWFGKDSAATKFRSPWEPKNIGQGKGTGERYDQVETSPFRERGLTSVERRDIESLKDMEANGAEYYQLTSLNSESSSDATSFSIDFAGNSFSRTNWKTNLRGMERLVKAGRVRRGNRTLRYKRYLKDFRATAVANYWEDTAVSGKTYVVQTAAKVIQRCLLMSTDPGDLVLDPTCGSGTTAYVAEQWGRRWITIDTSRVALALARSRIMGARYPNFILKDSREGQVKESELSRSEPSTLPVFDDIRQGFVYERIPHVTLRSIVNNVEIDVIWERFEEKLDSLRERMNTTIGVLWEDWEIPRDNDETWTREAKSIHTDWWKTRIALQLEINASIEARADYEYMYDRPYEDRTKVRVAGPFTVESLSPHRILAVDENDELIDGASGNTSGGTEERDFAQMILDNLRTAGVQQAHKEDRIDFQSLVPWPGQLVCAQGHYFEGGDKTADRKSAGIFVGPEFGTVSRTDLVEAAREAADTGFDVLVACAFNFDAMSTEFDKLGKIPILKARMNVDLHMANDLKNTGSGNLFVVFGEPDIEVVDAKDDQIQIRVNGVDVFDPASGEVRSDDADGIACWFIDTDYNQESFFVRHAYFLGQNDPYRSLKITLKTEIDQEAWESLHSAVSRPFPRPESGRIAVKVINHLGDEVMKVFGV